ncbi:MAG: hypothetical protein ACFCVD_13675 [Nodosilinea sp.]
MVRRYPEPGGDADLGLFADPREPDSAAQSVGIKGLAYRSLFLLGGLWFAMICISALAYSRLMFTEPQEVAPAPAASSTVAASPGLALTVTPLVTADDLAPSTALDQAANPVAELPQPAHSQGSKVAIWGLLSLVGLCAMGCFAIAQQAKASPQMAQGKKSRRPIWGSHPLRPQPAQPKRMTPYSPARDGVVVPRLNATTAPSRSGSNRPHGAKIAAPTGPGSTPGRRGAASPPSAGYSATGRLVPMAATVPPSVVVPADEDLPLDWAEASIAHSLDLRQRRSLSSFM